MRGELVFGVDGWLGWMLYLRGQCGAVIGRIWLSDQQPGEAFLS